MSHSHEATIYADKTYTTICAQARKKSINGWVAKIFGMSGAASTVQVDGSTQRLIVKLTFKASCTLHTDPTVAHAQLAIYKNQVATLQKAKNNVDKLLK